MENHSTLSSRCFANFNHNFRPGEASFNSDWAFTHSLSKSGSSQRWIGHSQSGSESRHNLLSEPSQHDQFFWSWSRDAGFASLGSNVHDERESRNREYYSTGGKCWCWSLGNHNWWSLLRKEEDVPPKLLWVTFPHSVILRFNHSEKIDSHFLKFLWNSLDYQTLILMQKI